MVTVLSGKDVTAYSDARGNEIHGTPSPSVSTLVEFRASNCRLVIGDQVKLHAAVIFHRDNSIVVIGRNSLIRGRITLGLDCRVSFGENAYCGLDLYVTAAEGASVDLGNDVLVANNCRLRADDSHPIYDGMTGRRINPSRSITVEDHVWLGQEALIMPGALIGTGAVVGARSMVTSSQPIPAHSLAVGNPAQVRRRNIHWVRKHLQTSLDVDDTVPSIFEPESLPSGGVSLTKRFMRRR